LWLHELWPNVLNRVAMSKILSLSVTNSTNVVKDQRYLTNLSFLFTFLSTKLEAKNIVKDTKLVVMNLKLIRDTSSNPDQLFQYLGLHLDLRSIIPQVVSCAPPISLRIAASIFYFYFISLLFGSLNESFVVLN